MMKAPIFIEGAKIEGGDMEKLNNMKSWLSIQS